VIRLRVKETRKCPNRKNWQTLHTGTRGGEAAGGENGCSGRGRGREALCFSVGNESRPSGGDLASSPEKRERGCAWKTIQRTKKEGMYYRRSVQKSSRANRKKKRGVPKKEGRKEQDPSSWDIKKCPQKSRRSIDYSE